MNIKWQKQIFRKIEQNVGFIRIIYKKQQTKSSELFCVQKNRRIFAVINPRNKNTTKTLL